MPYYLLVPELNGIEIYFDKKPNSETREKLSSNYWHWNRAKLCWYTKYSQAAEKLAIEICNKANSSKNNNLFGNNYNRSISFQQKSQFTTTNITIKKTNEKYIVTSSSNQISCIDCNKFYSIHALACIHCGCPLSYTLEKHFNRQIKLIEQKLKKQAEEREATKQQEEKIYKENKIENIERRYSIYISIEDRKVLMTLPISQFNEIIEKASLLYKNRNALPYISSYDWFNIVSLNERNFNKKIDELKKEKINADERRKLETEKIQKEFTEQIEYCKRHGVPENTIKNLLSRYSSFDKVKERIDLIQYYKKTYPWIDFSAGSHYLVPTEELVSYIQKRKKLNK